MNKNRAVARMLIANLFKINREEYLADNIEDLLSALLAASILMDEKGRAEYFQENSKEIAIEMIAFLEEFFKLSPEDKIKEILSKD